MEFASKTLNARQESLTEKASFKHLVNRNRCLVPSTGFFEWQSNGKQKTPFFVKDAQQAIFSIAGLHDTWFNGSTGKLDATFTLLTTEANAFMAEIHNTKKRMPLILSIDEEALWLKGAIQLEQLALRTTIQLEAWEVDKKRLLSPRANVAAVQDKYQRQIGKQTGLFD
jgi:putative SOS response-associated peptidase YedK